MTTAVVSVSLAPSHKFSKVRNSSIQLLEGLGVEGDAHCGATVKHRSRVAKDPNQPNLRQVHLIHSELFDELAAKGFRVSVGQLGENITTRGLDLLALPQGTDLRFDSGAIVRITGLRNPCVQIDRFSKGLLSAVLDRSAKGALIRKAGVMGIVVRGGSVSVGDEIQVELPSEPHRALAPV